MNALAQELNQLVLNQRPCQADAIIWLQGDRFDRAPKTLELFKQGFAPRIVITGNDVLIGKDQRIEEDNISLNDMKNWLLANGIAEKKIIVENNSMNTRDQAVNILEIAQQQNWSNFLLVGSSYYQMRAFLTFLKRALEINWPGRIVNQPAMIVSDSVPEGREKTASQYFETELEKISKYKDHVASIEQGLEYLK